MAKLTKFKAQQVEFPTHYEVEETNRGNNKIKSIVPAVGNIRENGTPETEEIYDGLQLGNVHTLQANKTTNLNIDYYVCNLDGLNEFGINNDLKLRINVDSKNTNSTTKLRLNNNDYTILKEYNGNLKQIESGDFKPNKTYELTYNGSQFIVINVDSRLNEIMGLEFAGNIQDAGDKVRGKCYFDNVTKFYYECIEDNSLTYNDSGKFRAISNKPLSDKVENLLGFKTTNFNARNFNGSHKCNSKTFLIGIHMNAISNQGNTEFSDIKWIPNSNGEWYTTQIFNNFVNSEGFKVSNKNGELKISYIDASNSGVNLIAIYEIFLN